MFNAVVFLILMLLSSFAIANTKVIIPLDGASSQNSQSPKWEERLEELDQLIESRSERQCVPNNLSCVDRLLFESEFISYKLDAAISDWRIFKTDTKSLLDFVLTIDINAVDEQRVNQNTNLFWVLKYSNVAISENNRELIHSFLDSENLYITEHQQRRNLAKRLSHLVKTNEQKLSQLKTRFIHIIKLEKQYLNTIHI